MRAEIVLSEDTTYRFLRWEIVFEGREIQRLRALGGPLLLKIGARDYVDNAGKYFERTEVEVPIYPHAGTQNFGQAKFTTYESRRLFVEELQAGVTVDAATFAMEARPGSVPLEGHVIALGLEPEPTPSA
jgi:hypothetical protein